MTTGSSGGSRAELEVEVRRSARRKRTVSAHREGERIVVVVPARMSRAEEARWVRQLTESLLARERAARRRGPRASDEALLRKCQELSRAYFGGAAEPASVRWSSNMAHRWGSCTPADRTIRVSERLRQFPDWVLDYVLVHELAHLSVNGHGPRFWELVGRYPKTERARGFLDGFSTAAGLPFDQEPEWSGPASSPSDSRSS